MIEEDVRPVKSHIVQLAEQADRPLNLGRQHGNYRCAEAVMGIMRGHNFTSKKVFSYSTRYDSVFPPFFAKVFRALSQEV